MQAIESRDEIVARITGERVDASIVKSDVINTCLLRILRGTGERDLADIVPVEVGSRVSLRHLDQCDSGAASNVGDFGPGLQLGDDSIELRQRARNELRAEPESQQSLDAAIHFRAELVIG